MSETPRRFENADDLRLITDAAPNIIAYIDRDHTYRFANRALAQWFDLPREEVVGRSARSLLGESDYERVAPLINRALQGEHVTHERPIDSVDGRRHYVQVTYTPDIGPTGDVEGVIVVATDISARKHAEAALAQQVAAFENIQDALIITDLEGRIQQVNQAFTKHTGYTREEAMGQLVSILHRPEERESLIAAISSDVAVHGIWSGEIAYVRKDLTEGISETVVIPLNNSDGQIVGLIGSNRDITDKKRAEMALSVAYRREVALNRISQAIRQTEDPREVQQIAAQEAAQALGADRALVILIDRDRDHVDFVTEWKREDLKSVLGRYTLSHFDVDLNEVFPANRPLVMTDRENTTLSSRTVEVLRAMQIRSMVDVPLSTDGQVVGVIGVYFAETDHDWTDDEIAFVEAVASQLRAATEASRLLAETVARAEREALLNRVSHAIRGHTDPAEIQAAAAAHLGAAFQADRCYYVNYSFPNDRILVAGDWYRSDLASIAGEYRASEFARLLEETFRDGRTMVTRDVDEVLSPEVAAVFKQFRLRSLIAVPLLDGASLVAALFVGMAEQSRDWTHDEVDVIQEVATMTRTSAEAARVRLREHAIATQLQSALLPPVPHEAPGLSIGVFYRSALQEASIGGDFYDVFPVDNCGTALVVGDLSGKGLEAATQVSAVRNMLRFALLNGDSLAGSIRQLNETLVRRELLAGFATLFVAVFDPVERTLIYVNCGQEPGLLRRCSDGRIQELAPTSPIVGLAGDLEFHATSVVMEPGDAFVAYTDGFTEVGDSRTNLLGVQGLVEMLSRSAAEIPSNGNAEIGAAAGLVERVANRVLEYGGAAVRDDMCMLGIVAS